MDELPLATSEWREHATRKFSEADLLRLAGQLDEAEAQGWVVRRYAPCGVSGHRHSRRWAARLCVFWMTMRALMGDVYKGEWDDKR